VSRIGKGCSCTALDKSSGLSTNHIPLLNPLLVLVSLGADSFDAAFIPIASKRHDERLENLGLVLSAFGLHLQGSSMSASLEGTKNKNAVSQERIHTHEYFRAKPAHYAMRMHIHLFIILPVSRAEAISQ
jgi:hypothetical protein